MTLEEDVQYEEDGCEAFEGDIDVEKEAPKAVANYMYTLIECRDYCESIKAKSFRLGKNSKTGECNCYMKICPKSLTFNNLYNVWNVKCNN